MDRRMVRQMDMRVGEWVGGRIDRWTDGWKDS